LKNSRGFTNNLISNKNAYYFETDPENNKITKITSFNINSSKELKNRHII
jgi:hypothetical protein